MMCASLVVCRFLVSGFQYGLLGFFAMAAVVALSPVAPMSAGIDSAHGSAGADSQVSEARL